MAKRITKADVEELNKLQVSMLCCLYPQPYSSRRGSGSKKAERVWNVIVQHTGGITAEAMEVEML